MSCHILFMLVLLLHHLVYPHSLHLRAPNGIAVSPCPYSCTHTGAGFPKSSTRPRWTTRVSLSAYVPHPYMLSSLTVPFAAGHTRDRDRDRSRDRPALLQILKPHHTALLALIARAHKRTGEREAAVQQARGRWADARARRDALKRRLLVRWATASVGGIATLEAAAGATLDGTDAGAEADGVKQGMPLIVSVADQELEREGVVRMRNITAGLEGVIPVMVPPRSGGGGDKDKSAARLPPAPIPAAPPVLATPQPRPAPLPPSDPQGHVGQLEAKLRKSSPTSRQSPAPNVNQTQFPSNDATMRQRPLSSSFPGEATSAMGIRRPPGSLAVTDGGLAMPQPQSQQFSVSPGVSPIPTPTISPVPPQTQSQAVSGTGTIAGLVPVPSPRSQLQHVQYASIRTSGRDAATQLQPPSPPPLRPLPDPAQSMMVPDMQPSPPSSKLKHSIQPLNIQQNLRPSQPSSKSNMSADVRPLPYHASPQSIPQSVPTRAALPQQQPPPQQPPPQQPPPPLPPLKQPLPPPPSRQQQLPPPPQQPLAPPPPSQPQGLQLNNPPSRDSYPTSREPKPSIRAASSSSSSSPSLAVHPGHISHPRTASDSSYIAMSQSQQPQSAERHPAVHGILKHTPPVVESTAAARRPSGAADTDPWAWGVKVAAATSSRPQPKLKTMFNLWRSAEGGKQQPQQQQHQGEASAESSARGGAQLPPLPESQSLSPKSRQQQNPRAATQTVRFVDGVQVIPRPAVDSDPYEDEDEDEDEEGLPPSPRRGSMIWLQDQDLDQDQEHEALTVESDEEFGGDGHEHVARGMGRDQHGGGGSVPVGHTATRSESSFSSASSSNWAEHSTTEVPSSSVSSTPSALTTSYLASYYMDVEDEEDGGDDLKDDDGTSWFSQQQRQAGIQTGEAVANDEKLKRREAGVDPSNNSLQGLYDDLHFADADSDTQHARYISQSAGSNSKVTTMAIRTAPRGSNQTQAQKATRQMSQGSAVSDHELLHSIFPSPAQSGISERDLLFSP